LYVGHEVAAVLLDVKLRFEVERLAAAQAPGVEIQVADVQRAAGGAVLPCSR
jgi:hypothetical protein